MFSTKKPAAKKQRSWETVSGYLTAVLREIRRFGSGFSQVDSVFLKKSQQGASTVDAPGSVFLRKTESTSENPDPKRRIWRGSVTIRKT